MKKKASRLLVKHKGKLVIKYDLSCDYDIFVMKLTFFFGEERE
jgi:hypothetical protein